MYKDFKKCIEGKLHTFIKITICLRLRQIRELSKLPKYYINKKNERLKRNLRVLENRK